jgi:hypothetical protein
MNPEAPNRHAKIKLQKQDMPIKTIINYTKAPAYGLSKYLSQTLRRYLHLEYVYNIRNSIHLITDLQSMEINKNMRMFSFDITNMYTNIPKLDKISIINILMVTQKLTETRKSNNTYTKNSNRTELFSILTTMLQPNKWIIHRCSNIRNVSGNMQTTHGSQTNISHSN